jgi:hypothetical protein
VGILELDHRVVVLFHLFLKVVKGLVELFEFLLEEILLLLLFFEIDLRLELRLEPVDLFDEIGFALTRLCQLYLQGLLDVVFVLLRYLKLVLQLVLLVL